MKFLHSTLFSFKLWGSSGCYAISPANSGILISPYFDHVPHLSNPIPDTPFWPALLNGINVLTKVRHPLSTAWGKPLLALVGQQITATLNLYLSEFVYIMGLTILNFRHHPVTSVTLCALACLLIAGQLWLAIPVSLLLIALHTIGQRSTHAQFTPAAPQTNLLALNATIEVAGEL